ncbi:MAG: hypothetical protein JNJ46_25890 [Myxococcales bacterium]|nr:hypothetical protein [Myxococcales bacterium]
MDTQNRFHTPRSFTWVRAEALLALLALVYLLFAFARDVQWSRFLVALALIDLVGYLPGALAYRRAQAASRGTSDAPPRIAPVFHHLYNVTHSFLFCAGVLGLWFAVLGDVEWAMLALPVHLLGDRGLFGNTYKPSSLPFEPAPLPPAARLAALSSAAAVGCPAPSCAASATAATPASGSPPAIARGR